VLRGELGKLLELELHSGDVWILLAMPVWGLYSVLLKRVPREIGGLALLFVIAASGVAMLLPWFLFQTIQAPPRWPSGAEVAGVLRSRGAGSAPSSAGRGRNAGSCTALRKPALSLSSAGFGVPRGAKRPFHTTTSKPSSDASSVGTSGNEGTRIFEAIA